MNIVLVVDDDEPNLTLLSRVLDESFEIATARSGPEALEIVERDPIAVVVSDHRMPGMTGVELLACLADSHPIVRRILLTAYSDRDLLLDAMRRSHVHDFVLKPWETDDLRLRIERALTAHQEDMQRLVAARERDALRDEIADRTLSTHGIVGLHGGGLGPLLARIERIAASDSTVMLRGETGTGKELLARELHRRSRRSAGPFIRVNCSAFAAGVLESELFGHEAGAFTGARQARVGRFEQANGGTIFLDEIGDVPEDVQIKLLRVLQEHELERVGGNRTIRVDVRVFAATHRDLEQMVAAASFRQDLFFRLNVVPLRVPPLRERPGDITLLGRHFVAEFARHLGKRLTLGARAIELLEAYDFPGNVRELRNVLERACVLADDDAELDVDDLLFDFARAAAIGAMSTAALSVLDEIDAEQAARLREALKQAGGNRARAARALGIARSTLNDRLRRLGIA